MSLIKDREGMKQLMDFTNMQVGTMYPTDIDGLLEYKDRAYFIFEVKHKSNKKLSTGQKLALERLTDDLAKTGKEVMCAIVSHNIDKEEDVDVSKCPVHLVRYKGKWIDAREYNFILVDLLEAFLHTLV